MDHVTELVPHRTSTASRALSIFAYPHFPESLRLPKECRLVHQVHDANVVIVFDRPDLAIEAVQVAAMPLVPMISLSEKAPAWFDFHGRQALTQGLRRAETILDRLDELNLPNHPSVGDLLLARLYSRQTEMTAQYDTSRREMVTYPAAGPTYAAVECANRLVEQGYLSRRFFDRTFTCAQCHGARLLAREECVECRSTNLSEQSLVNHFRCGHEAPESSFKLGANRFECPKCNRELRHIGLDYDKPGSVVICGVCATMNDSAAVGFVCADCKHHHDAEAVPRRDWFDFQLTPGATHLLRSGGSSDSSTVTARDPLRVLVDQACSLREELGQEFQLVRVLFKAAPQIRQRSPRIWEQSYALSLDVGRSAVRRIDRVGETHDGLMVFLAGLNAKEASKAIAAIRKRLGEVIGDDLDPEFTLLDEAAVQDGCITEPPPERPPCSCSPRFETRSSCSRSSTWPPPYPCSGT